MNALTVAAKLSHDFPVQVRYPLASLAVELDRLDPLLAARAVAALARVLELDPDVLASLVKQEED